MSVATLAKVRAWVRAWRAKTKASDLTRLVGGEGRDVEKNEKNKFTKKKTNRLRLRLHERARCGARLRGSARRASVSVRGLRHAVRALGVRGRWKRRGPNRVLRGGNRSMDPRARDAARRRRDGNGNGEKTNAARAFVFCPACHDAFLVRALTRCDPSANACHACGSRVPRSATIVQSTAGGRGDVRLLRLFTEGKKKSKPEPERRKNRKRIRNSRATEDARVSRDDVRRRRSTEEDGVGPCHDIKRGPFRNFRAFFHRVRARSSRVRVPGRGGRPRLGRVASRRRRRRAPVALAWDAEARRARNAETDVRWRVPSLPGSSRVARNAETDAPGDETNSETNWGFLHAGMPPPLEADDFPARHASSFR